MFNLVVLTGRLTADPELKTTPSGVPVCNFTIAVNRNYRAGEEQQADFINVTAWRGTAEFISKYFTKGKMIGIEGAIQTHKYQDKDGNKRTAFEVVVNNAQFVEGKKEGNESTTTESDPLVGFSNKLDEFTEVSGMDGDLPF